MNITYRLYLLLLSVFSFAMLHGQSTFQKTYGAFDTILPNLICTGIAYDNTNNSLILGTGATFGGPTVPGVTKMDTCGNVIWSRKTSESGIMFFNTITTYSGNSTMYFSSDGAIGSWIGTFATFNSSGVLTTVNTAYTNATAFDAHPVGAKRLSNGDHLITGYASRTNNFKDIWFAKLDPAGVVIWSKQSGQFDFFWENGWGVDVNSAETAYYFVGQNISFSNNNSTDIHIIKTDVNGLVLWEKQVSTPGTDVAYAVKVMPNDDVVVGGTTDGPSGVPLITLLRFDTNGNLLWSSYYDGPGNNNLCKNLNLLPNGNLLLTGYCNGFGAGLLDGLLMEINSNGNIVWQRAYGSADDNSFTNSVILNNSIYTAGNIDSTGSPGKTRVHLVKTRLNGTFDPVSGCTEVITSFTQTPIAYTIYDTTDVVNNSLTTTLSLSGVTVSPNEIIVCGAPTASFALPPSACVNQTFSLTNLSSGGATSWTWTSNPGNIPNANSFNQSALSFSAPGIYTIVLYASNCTGTDTCTRTININLTNTISLFSNGPLCINSALSLSTALPANSYSWSGPNGFVSSLQNPVIANVQLNNGGTYSLTVTQATSGCLSSGTISVQIFPIPQTAIAINGPNPVCSGSAIQLTGTGATTYTWLPGGSTSSVLPLSPTVNNTYTLIGANPGGCQTTASIAITVNPLPVVSVTGPSVICANSPATLTANGANNYNWNTGTAGPLVVVNPSVNSTYSVTGTNANGCLNTGTFQILVNPLPLVTIAGPAQTCVSQTLALTALGANTFTWNTGAQTSNIVINPVSTSNYSVIGVNATGCVGAATFVLNVVQIPTLSINGPKKICAGDGVALTATGALNYLWSTGASTPVLIDFPITDRTYTLSAFNAPIAGCAVTGTFAVVVNPVPSLTISGNSQVCIGNTTTLSISGADVYLWNDLSTGSSIIINSRITNVVSVKGTYTTTGCATVLSKTIDVFPLPQVRINGPAGVCKGRSATYTALGARSYTWNTGLTGASYSIQPTSATSFTVKGTSVNGCTNQAALTVNVLQSPTVSILGSTLVCLGDQLFFTADGASRYFWSNGSSGKTLLFTPTNNSELSVVGYNENNCFEVARTNIQVKARPRVSIIADSILSGCQVVYTFKGSKDPAITSYDWKLNDQIISGLPELTLPVNQNTVLTIALRVSSSEGCTADAKQTISTDKFFDNLIFFPDAFTPNQDGKNETWSVYSECLETWQCRIYNRWGQLVASLKNGEQWDGNYKGLPAPDNVYVYKFTGTFYSKKSYARAGHITLYR